MALMPEAIFLASSLIWHSQVRFSSMCTPKDLTVETRFIRNWLILAVGFTVKFESLCFNANKLAQNYFHTIQTPNRFENRNITPYNLKIFIRIFQPKVGRKISIFSPGQKKKNVLVKKSVTPHRNNNLNFRLARDQAVLLETAANLWATRPQANNFFAVCFILSWNKRIWLESITKHLITSPTGNSEFHLSFRDNRSASLGADHYVLKIKYQLKEKNK